GVVSGDPSYTCTGGVCVAGEPKQDFATVSGVNGESARLDDRLQFDSVSLTSVSGDNGGAAVRLFGRFFVNFLYDGRTATETTGLQPQFPMAFPKTTYVLEDRETGSITWDVLGIALPHYLAGGKVEAASERDDGDPMPFPIGMNKGAAVQSTPVSESV